VEDATVAGLDVDGMLPLVRYNEVKNHKKKTLVGAEEEMGKRPKKSI
jgi:hypothetical protein